MKTTILVLAVVLSVTASDPEFVPIVGGLSGSGSTTRYWDCCKPSCSWKENIKTKDMIPVASCAKNGVTAVNETVKSGCDLATGSYMCNNQQPWKVSDNLAYGFAAASFTGGIDTNLCCACFKLDFTDQLVGKSFVVQVTNTGGDLGHNQFDLALPGGGVGIFPQGCHNQWNAPWNGWGQTYGGVSSRAQCLSDLPAQLQPGCLFRFDWFKNANNPKMKFTQVQCPSAIVSASKCNLALS